MPSTFTHAIIAEKVIDKLEDNPKKILTKNVNNFRIYAQGMDVLYFYKFYKNNYIQKVGHDFHDNYTYEVFKYLIDINKDNKDLELFSFIAGLVCHYKADSIIHPYINYYSSLSNNIKDTHLEYETYLDNYFVKKEYNVNNKTFNHSKNVFNCHKSEVIRDILNNLFKKFFNLDNIGDYYYKGLDSMKFVFNYGRFDKYGFKKVIYKFVDKLKLPIRRIEYVSYHFDSDYNSKYFNDEHNTWYNINDKTITSNKSLNELMDDVINESSFIINDLYLYIFNNKEIDLYDLIGNYSYASGLILKK